MRVGKPGLEAEGNLHKVGINNVVPTAGKPAALETLLLTGINRRARLGVRLLQFLPQRMLDSKGVWWKCILAQLSCKLAH